MIADTMTNWPGQLFLVGVVALGVAAGLHCACAERKDRR